MLELVAGVAAVGSGQLGLQGGHRAAPRTTLLHASPAPTCAQQLTTLVKSCAMYSLSTGTTVTVRGFR